MDGNVLDFHEWRLASGVQGTQAPAPGISDPRAGSDHGGHNGLAHVVVLKQDASWSFTALDHAPCFVSLDFQDVARFTLFPSALDLPSKLDGLDNITSAYISSLVSHPLPLGPFDAH